MSQLKMATWFLATFPTDIFSGGLIRSRLLYQIVTSIYSFGRQLFNILHLLLFLVFSPTVCDGLSYVINMKMWQLVKFYENIVTKRDYTNTYSSAHMHRIRVYMSL